MNLAQTATAPAFAPRLPRVNMAFMLTAMVVLAAALFVRLYPLAGFQGTGMDEWLYMHYLQHLDQVGLWNYPDVVDAYIQQQKTLTGSVLPPTRFLYIFFAYIWEHMLEVRPQACFYAVSKCFGVLCVLLSWVFAWRLLRDRWLALGVLALVACSPLQIHMAQHALVDGFFTFWALLTLWSLWEALLQPEKRVWPVLHGIGLAAMVLTKENAFFVFVACLALLALNRWVRFGQVTRSLLLATSLGPLIGVALLVNLAGGVPTLLEAYQLSVSKNYTLPYAILTGDGPWYRYLLDLMTISPVVLILALTSLFQLRVSDRSGWFLLIFMMAGYAIMANLKYGMNVRYATIWDTPLRILALGQVVAFCQRLTDNRSAHITVGAMVASIVLLCSLDLWQYHRLAVAYPLYELIPLELLRALKILKD